MRQAEADRLIKKAVEAFDNGSPDFQSIMDDASVKLSDAQWLHLEAMLHEAQQKPVLPETPEQEQARLEAEVERLRRELEDAKARLSAFYSKKHSKR